MKEAFEIATAQNWQNYINHAIKKQKMWEQDNLNKILLKDLVLKLIVTVVVIPMKTKALYFKCMNLLLLLLL